MESSVASWINYYGGSVFAGGNLPQSSSNDGLEHFEWGTTHAHGGVPLDATAAARRPGFGCDFIDWIWKMGPWYAHAQVHLFYGRCLRLSFSLGGSGASLQPYWLQNLARNMVMFWSYGLRKNVDGIREALFSTSSYYYSTHLDYVLPLDIFHMFTFIFVVQFTSLYDTPS